MDQDTPLVVQVVVHKPISLIRLVLTKPALFYKQDWYYDEDFAHRVIAPGTYQLGKNAPAALYAYFFVKVQSPHWDNRYAWAEERDNAGNRVYVGGVCLGWSRGFQIHRYLESPPVCDTLW